MAGLRHFDANQFLDRRGELLQRLLSQSRPTTSAAASGVTVFHGDFLELDYGGAEWVLQY